MIHFSRRLFLQRGILGLVVLVAASTAWGQKTPAESIPKDMGGTVPTDGLLTLQNIGLSPEWQQKFKTIQIKQKYQLDQDDLKILKAAARLSAARARLNEDKKLGGAQRVVSNNDAAIEVVATHCELGFLPNMALDLKKRLAENTQFSPGGRDKGMRFGGIFTSDFENLLGAALARRITERTVYRPNKEVYYDGVDPPYCLQLPENWLDGLTVAERKRMEGVRFVAENALTKLTRPYSEVLFEDMCYGKLNGTVIEQTGAYFPAAIANKIQVAEKNRVEKMPRQKGFKKEVPHFRSEDDQERRVSAVTRKYLENVVFPRHQIPRETWPLFHEIGYVYDSLLDLDEATKGLNLGVSSLCQNPFLNQPSVGLVGLQLLGYTDNRKSLADMAPNDPKEIDRYLRNHAPVIQEYLERVQIINDHLKHEHTLMQEWLPKSMEAFAEKVSSKEKTSMNLLVQATRQAISAANQENDRADKQRQKDRTDPRVALAERLKAERQ